MVDGHRIARLCRLLLWRLVFALPFLVTFLAGTYAFKIERNAPPDLLGASFDGSKFLLFDSQAMVLNLAGDVLYRFPTTAHELKWAADDEVAFLEENNGVRQFIRVKLGPDGQVTRHATNTQSDDFYCTEAPPIRVLCWGTGFPLLLFSWPSRSGSRITCFLTPCMRCFLLACASLVLVT